MKFPDIKFKAAMFDFDGTLTQHAQYKPDRETVLRLARLAMKMPIAICTGRQLESFLRDVFTALIEEIPVNFHNEFLSNLYLVAENGSIGYAFDSVANEFNEFYRIDWPENFAPRLHLMDEINEAVKEHGAVYFDKHRVVVVIRTNYHHSGDIQLINGLSSKIYDICTQILTSHSVNFLDYVHIGDSGIGVVICPANGDKDTGIKNFAEFLSQSKGLNFEKNARDILVVGDSPEFRGNDHYFLNGTFGTPFTVGNIVKNSAFPYPVYNDMGELLKGPSGTICLIDQVL